MRFFQHIRLQRLVWGVWSEITPAIYSMRDASPDTMLMNDIERFPFLNDSSYQSRRIPKSIWPTNSEPSDCLGEKTIAYF